MIKLKNLLTENEGRRRIPLSIMQAEMDDFVRGYIKAAFFSSTDNSTPSGGEPLNKNYDLGDLESSTFIRMLADCRNFYKKYEKVWTDAGWSDEQAGIDFWYTRSGAGTGFWDNQLNAEHKHIGDQLTKAAKQYGEYNLYVGDDGLIHGG